MTTPTRECKHCLTRTRNRCADEVEIALLRAEVERQKAVIGAINVRCDHLAKRRGEVIRERDALKDDVERLLSMPALMRACDALGVRADGEHCAILRAALSGRKP